MAEPVTEALQPLIDKIAELEAAVAEKEEQFDTLAKIAGARIDKLESELAKAHAEVTKSAERYYVAKDTENVLGTAIRDAFHPVSKNLLKRSRVTKGATADSPHDLTHRIRKAREKSERDGRVS